MVQKSDFKKIHDYLWEIPKTFRADMRVPARAYVDEKQLEESLRDRSFEQLVNLTTLPGIQKYSIAMPDVHEGYGSPIGGVAAMDADTGVISPGMVGYDINCGVRMLRSSLLYSEAGPHLARLVGGMYDAVPSGLGHKNVLKLNAQTLDEVLREGAPRLIEMGYGDERDLEYIESQGHFDDADPAAVSQEAKSRGRDQLGTIGSGNHFAEAEYVEKIFDKEAAKILGLFENQVTILIHTGSRGLGHQIATDYIREMMGVMQKYGIVLPDRELAAAPFSSSEGQRYFSAMKAGAHFAWCNRELIAHSIRKVWADVFGAGGGSLELIYDVAHNMAKLEEYEIDGKKKQVIVHRKGATRSFGRGHAEIPAKYKDVGQPVLIPGSMGTASYVLAGEKRSEEETFASSCHGAGRTMSRHQAKRMVSGKTLKQELEKEGIHIAAGSFSGLAEEAPLAYKDVDRVVEVVEKAGIARRVARLKPIGVVKG
ncbi:MAG: RtcB family protein [Candidatus Sungiibacteriota bacterium]